jgi:purine-binding chemotaxis protein CheW
MTTDMTKTPARETLVDWNAVRERLRRSDEALREVMLDTPEHMTAVLRKRAVQLAKESVWKTAASKSSPALLFRLGQERYAVNLNELVEVLPFLGCIAVPGGNPQFLGVINRRGEILPVIDLARVLNGSASTDPGAVLVLRRQVGLKVDRAEELRDIGDSEVAPRAEGRFCRALSPGTMALLDVEALLAGVCSPAAGILV